MYLDASAIKTVLLREAGWSHVALRIEDHRAKLITSPITVYEATIAIAGDNPSETHLAEAREIMRDFLREVGVKQVVISEAQTQYALDIYTDQMTRGSAEPLDMNDAFIMAIAKSFRSKILFTNERFSDK